jgi:hypothetical protein
MIAFLLVTSLLFLAVMVAGMARLRAAAVGADARDPR